MKKLIGLFLIMTVCLFSQNWNNVVETTISFPDGGGNAKLGMFVNKDGTHIIVRYYDYPAGNIFNYYLVNCSGSVVRSTNFTTESNAEFPKISGNNDKVYLAYKLGSELRVKKSTDAGASWSTDISALPLGSNSCNGIDIVYDYQGLHVVYAMKDSDPNYETYYFKLNSSNAWVDYKNVTDYNSEEVGGFPSIAVSNERVHVSYNTSTNYSAYGAQGIAKTRDKFVNTWQVPQTVLTTPNYSSSEFLAVSGSDLYDFYLKFVGGGGQFYNNLKVKSRPISGTSWGTETELTLSANYSNFGKSVTNDGKLHIIYNTYAGLFHKFFDGTQWNNEEAVSSNYPYLYSLGFKAISNDLFIVWGNRDNQKISFRQYDDVPLAPPNFAGTTQSNHPKLTWSNANEPDVYAGGHIKVYRGYEEGGVTYWGVAEIIDGNRTDWVDNYVFLTSPKLQHVDYYYKVSAIDIGAKESPATTPIHYYGDGYMWKTSGGANTEELEIKEYRLSQNYPNPFNPSTEINYQIPAKGFVTLRVYDMLGNEVAVLVNEWQEVGSYNAQFTTSGKQLASGMYFYTLNAGKFTDTKKFILLK